MNFAMILVKVRSGHEDDVSTWLEGVSERSQQGGKDGCCPFGADAERSNSVKWTDVGHSCCCEEMRVESFGYVTGPYDFMVFLVAPNTLVIERFIIRCLRAGSIAEYVMDTQTIAGNVRYLRPGAQQNEE